VRLLKDVDGIYADDPKRDPAAPRFAQLDYDEALKASRGLVQDKAIRAAAADGVVLEVAELGAGQASAIRRGPARIEPLAPRRRLRVALLGCGAVGGGVLVHMRARPDLFHLNPVLVRDAAARQAEHGGAFTESAEDALAGADLVVEALGGADGPADIIEAALRGGAAVVTANKAAVAAHYDRLQAASEASGARLAFSAAVGGGAPALETASRLRAEDGVRAVEGVMNGTANFILHRLETGASFDEAVAEAQALGFAEADPAADVDGHDAADKLALLARAAFGAALAPRDIPKQSLASVSAADAQAARRDRMGLKQVGRLQRRADGALDARVEIRALPDAHPLAGAQAEQNRFRFEAADGAAHLVYGKGAGRWPTAAAVFADVMDAAREAVEKSAPGRMPARTEGA
jgi:homoserine dehydrogenase